MRRRALLALLLCAPLAARAQLDFGKLSEGTAPGDRPGVDEALRRTVILVLRAEARAGTLPDFMTDPEPLPEELAAVVRVDERLPEDFPARLAPERVDRRLPHKRGSTVWAVAGTWMFEIDAVRRRILSVAPDVLPPDI